MTADVLNQEEVEALLHGVDDGRVDTAPQAAPGVARVWDFNSRLPGAQLQLPVLELLNERFVRQLRGNLFGMLRRSADIEMLPLESPKLRDYLPTLHVPASLNVVRFAPLPGMGLVVLEPKLVFAMIDNYFGGTGRAARIEGREFTPTEQHLIQLLLRQVFSALTEAWTPVLKLEPEYVKSEINPDFVSVASPTDTLVVCRFLVQLEGGGGEIHLTLPLDMLEPVRALLREGAQPERPPPDADWSQDMRNHLEDAEVDLVTVLCQARVTLGELLDMQPGDVLPCGFDGRATVMADGAPLFHGEMGQQRGKQVVRVTEMVTRKNGNALDSHAARAR